MGEELGLGLQTLENICIINVANVNRLLETLENICIINVADVNRVLKTRFTSGRYVEKMPTQTRSEHENRPSKTRYPIRT